MPTIDEDFETLANDVADTFGKSAGVTLRFVESGAIDTATLKRTPTNTDYAIVATRTLAAQQMTAGRAGKSILVRATYRVPTARLTALGATRPPRAGDMVIDADGTVNRIVLVDDEVNQQMWALHCQSDRSGA